MFGHWAFFGHSSLGFSHFARSLLSEKLSVARCDKRRQKPTEADRRRQNLRQFAPSIALADIGSENGLFWEIRPRESESSWTAATERLVRRGPKGEGGSATPLSGVPADVGKRMAECCVPSYLSDVTM
jgi:hypothetical protein